ncbi:MAG TPA: hypothetical protein VGZ04_03285 [Acidimicrobiales bacterium]|jgi:carbon starvation protein CstA|nr:hypothetical protein [Acidimicrobiales bacterium]
MRKTFLFLGVATLSVGVWFLFRTAPSNAACGALSSPLTGTGVSPKCQNLLSTYFMGYGLMLSGLMVVLLSLVSMAKHQRRRNDYRRDAAPIAHRRIHDANESQRRAA